MFERFTDRARRVLVLAQEEARRLNHDFIGTEHILLGLIQEGDGLAAKALSSLGISDKAVRVKVEERTGPTGSSRRSGNPPFTPRAKKVLELGLREALQLGHNYIGTEHILLGLLREGDGVAAQVLKDLGADLVRAHEQVVELLAGFTGGGAAASGVVARHLGEQSSPFGHPTRVIPGPESRLSSGGVEFRVVGVLGYHGGVEVLWRISGVPGPIADLIGRGFSPSPPADPARRHNARLGAGGALRYVTIADDKETEYVAADTTFEPQHDGDWAGRSAFAPGLSDGASRLVVRWQDEALELAL